MYAISFKVFQIQLGPSRKGYSLALTKLKAAGERLQNTSMCMHSFEGSRIVEHNSWQLIIL